MRGYDGVWWYSSTAGGILYKSFNEAFPRGRYAAEVRRAAFGRLSHRNPAALCMGDLKKWEGLRARCSTTKSSVFMES